MSLSHTMRKFSSIIAGVLFFLLFFSFILFVPFTSVLFPTSQIPRKPGIKEAALREGVVLIQEIRMDRNYLLGIDIALQQKNAEKTTRATLLILDSTSKILYSKTFTGDDHNQEWFSFRMSRPVFAGTGNKIFICLAGNGDRESYLSLFFNRGDGETGLFARGVQQGKLIEALLPWIRNYIRTHRLSPWKTYAITSAITGTVFCLLNPPFQSPDANEHLFRAWQISDLQLYGWHRTVPASLVDFESGYSDLFFGQYYTFSLRDFYLPDTPSGETNQLVERKTKNDITGYIPQAITIRIARALGFSWSGQLLAVRLINLLVSIFLISLAIKKIPAGKWLLFLLGMMPMTLLLISSPSSFGLRIGVAFLILAWFMDLARGSVSRISFRDWAWLCGLSILLGMSQFPYLLVCITALLIPREKFGNLKRYLLFIGLLVFSVILASPLWKGDQLFYRFNSDRLIHEQGLPEDASRSVREIPGSANIIVPEQVDEAGQKNSLLQHPGRFLSVLYTTLNHNLWLYLRSFVGILGWLTIELPVWLVVTYLLALCLSLLSCPTGDGHLLKAWERFLFPGLFLSGALLIGAGLYITWTPVGAHYIEGIQGRYFIPYAPLLFLAFMPGRKVSSALERFKPFMEYGFLLFTITTSVISLLAIVSKFSLDA